MRLWKKKKRNEQDLTLRNLRAMKKRLEKCEKAIQELKKVLGWPKLH